MKKLKLLFTTLALLVGGGVNSASAVTGSELTATTTDCFLYSVGAEKYLTAGDWWGTHATVSTAGMDLDLTKINDGVYTIGTRQAGSRFLSGVWMDGSSMNFTFNEVDATNHYYTISYIDGETTKYLYYTGSTVEGMETAPTTNIGYWQVVTRANFLSSLSGATKDAPKDATGAIYNAGFFCLDYATVKNTNFPVTRSWQGTQLTDTWGYRGNESGVNGSNYCVEQYSKTFDNYQELTGIPLGMYVLKNQGFYKGDNPGYLYANNKQVALTKITVTPDAPEGYTNNDLQRASYAFGIADLYHNEAPTVLVTDGTLRIGTKAETGTNTWYCFDNFTLSYLGTPSYTNAYDATDYISNPSFSSAYTTGWTLDGTAPNDYNSEYGSYENYHRIGGLHQDLTGLPNGVYKVTMQAAVRYDGQTTGTFNLYATTSNGTTKSPSTVAAHTNFATMASTMAGDETFARIEVYAIVTDGKLTIGHYESEANTWPVFDNYTLTYYGEDLAAAAAALTAEANKLNPKITALSTSDLKTELNNFYTSISNASYSTLAEYITAIQKVDVKLEELNDANALYIAAKAIADVAYIETTSGSHTTYNTALSSFITSVVDSNADGEVDAAEGALKTAIKTYISGAKPTSESDYFDITCLIVNPNFDNNTTDGWTYTKDGGTNAAAYTCNEFYNNTFNFYQELTGLPNGSYQLSVQAFCRPGGNGNTTSGAYYDYYNGINNVTAELYINTQSSKVGNIYSYKDNTTGAKTNDFHCTGLGDDNYWVPNNMEGASGYFADGAYVTETAARVTDDDSGKLRIGFRDGTLTAAQWTIFDNFKLYYYGPSLMRYYQQYLPQLEDQIADDYLNNAAYDILKTGQTERTALVTANSVEAETLSTEAELQQAIDDITTARDNFDAAKTAYDNLNTAATSYAYNIGDGVFQMSSEQQTIFDNAVNTATTMYSTGTASKADVMTQIAAIANAYVLIAPNSEKRYWVSIVEDGKDWNGNAITFIAGGRNGEGNYAIKYLTTSNANLCQAIKFTATTGNKYKMSVLNADGTEQYLTTNSLAYGSNKNQIRMTDDASKALEVEIKATSTSGQFQLYNTEADAVIANNNNNDMYTANSCNFTIAEASQASVEINIDGGIQYATRIFPFAPTTWPNGVVAYSCEAASDDVLTLEKVATPAANVPYILFAENGSSGSVSGFGTAGATSYTAGWLTGVYEKTDAPVGSYVLQNNNDKVAFYLVAEDEQPEVGANRCYLNWVESGAGARAFYFPENNATAIKAIDALTSGKAEIFNASGVQIPALQKGMNIIRTADGKSQKVMVK